MLFQIKYVKKGELRETMEKVEFTNLAALKRWYKKEYEAGNMEFDFFSGWDYENNKPFSYSRRIK